MFRELKTLEDKYRRLTLSLSDPAFLSNPQKVREISKERAELEPVIFKYEEYKKVARNKAESLKILEDPAADQVKHRISREALADGTADYLHRIVKRAEGKEHSSQPPADRRP